MHRRRLTGLTWMLALLFVASAAVAAPVCRRDCCRGSASEASAPPAAGHDHCAPEGAPAPPAHEGCGCHELGSSDAGAPTPPAAGTAMGGADLVPFDVRATVASAVPRPAPGRVLPGPPGEPRQERAPPLYLQNESFLN